LVVEIDATHRDVFFKHEDEGAGPRMAAAFREVVKG